MIDQMTNENYVYDHDGWLMYQQEQWEAKHNWLAFTLGTEKPFTRSNGTLMARIYERLTKASRRRAEHPHRLAWGDSQIARIRREEQAYRQGAYDTLQALQDELA